MCRHKFIIVSGFAAAILVGLLGTGAGWADVVQDAKLTASDAAAGDYFGRSVGISGSYAVSGAYGDDDAGGGSGSAYIYYKDQGGVDTWGQQAKLTASDAAGDDYFGYAVNISNSYTIVGAYGDDDNGSLAGSAYIFYKDQGGTNNWGQQVKLTATDTSAGDRLGCSVGISGAYAISGAYGDDDGGSRSDAGSAYIFYKDQGGANTWGQQAKFTASDAAASDYFGKSVAISGSYAISGAYGDDDAGSYSGSAYIFYKDQGGTDAWGQQIKLTASDAASDDCFGYSVAISGDYAVAGAYSDDDIEKGSNSGSAYVFKRDGDQWTQIAKLTADDGAADDKFGYSVAIDGEKIIIGTYWDDDNGDSSGSAYIFELIGEVWTQTGKITAADGAADDEFGYSVGVSGDYFFAGARGDDSDTGSTYLYSTTPDVSTLTMLLVGGFGVLLRGKGR
ncbi:MAG: FG-GAP repeat protein [Phycisphaerae bacterium]|nr:FG-GAP repeat protein [Phycisphaerae bacterium]